MKQDMLALNADMTKSIFIDVNAQEWSPSPSGTVWRKRLHLYGPKEAGQVTSIVRYEPNSSFPPHDHPEGEEIFVLEGVFSDEHGDWPAGTYLLNPEGFRHAPFSREGCVLFVKLRQYPGNRKQITINSSEVDWLSGTESGLAFKSLYKEDGFPEEVRLEKIEAGGSIIRGFPGGGEILILSGSINTASQTHPMGSWIRLPAGSKLEATSIDGCELYVKTGALPHLRQPK